MHTARQDSGRFGPAARLAGAAASDVPSSVAPKPDDGNSRGGRPADGVARSPAGVSAVRNRLLEHFRSSQNLNSLRCRPLHEPVQEAAGKLERRPATEIEPDCVNCTVTGICPEQTRAEADIPPDGRRSAASPVTSTNRITQTDKKTGGGHIVKPPSSGGA